MKARDKETRKEFKVRGILTPTADAYAIEEVDLFFDESDQVELLYREDYWERLRHQYVGMAMQGIVMNEKMQEDLYKAFGKNESMDVTISDFAIDIAHTLVQKLKEERNEKV